MKTIHESANVIATEGPGRMLIKIITPGQGSSGYYAPEVLEAAAKDKVFPRGTQMHINHDSLTETAERPEGDLRDLAAVLEEDAYIDPSSGALVAEALVSSAWRTFLSEFHEYIGASIAAEADLRYEKDPETGVSRTVVERLVPNPMNRVDFVTIAGRGGSILQVLESARAVSNRSVVAEAFAEDKRTLLSAAVRDLVSPKYTWLVDYDEGYVIYEAESATGYEYLRRSYVLNGTDVTLGDDETPVRRRTEYDPINPPSESAGVQENAKLSQEDTVAKIEIEETELAQLRESASRVEALEKAEQERAEKAAKAAKESRIEEAHGIIREAFGTTEVPKMFARIAESAATAEDFDVEAFRTEVNEAAAIREAEGGAGEPRGLGDSAPVVKESAKISNENIVNALHGKA